MHHITSIISGTDCISISSKFKSLGSARALYAFPNLTHFSNLALFCWSVPLLHLRASFSIRLKAEPRAAPGSFSISAPTKPVTPWSIAKKCSIFFELVTQPVSPLASLKCCSCGFLPERWTNRVQERVNKGKVSFLIKIRSVTFKFSPQKIECWASNQ